MTQTHDEATVERVAKAINGPHDATHIGEKKLRELQDHRWLNQTDKSERVYCESQARAALSALPPQEVSVQEASGMVALRACLSRMWSEKQDGIPSYMGNGQWGFVSTGLPQVTPDELNDLFEFAGMEPQEIVFKGSCATCAHAVNGRERGYSMPCVRCLRPSHDLWEPSLSEKPHE